MPELPEVEHVVQMLRPFVEGRRLSAVRILNPSIVRSGLKQLERGVRGQSVLNIGRQGKYILMHLSSGACLVFHLGMTGRMYFAAGEEPLERHTHLLIDLQGQDRQLRHTDARRFGGVFFLQAGGDAGSERWSRLGPDALDLDQAAFRKLFEARRGRMKALLLNQALVAGIGNIYADEMLHRAGIHPRQQAAAASRLQLERLYRQMGRILRRAIAAGGSSISDYVDPDRYRGEFQNFFRVYGRESEPCLSPRCGGTVRRIVVAGRSSHFCPTCQRMRYPRRRRRKPAPGP